MYGSLGVTSLKFRLGVRLGREREIEMGADLVLSMLEIPKGRTPDFFAAEDFIKNLPDDKILMLLDHRSSITGSDPGTFLEEVSGETISKDNRCQVFRNMLLQTCETIRQSWESNIRDVKRINLSRTTILVTGGMSWGDIPEMCEEFELFEDSGAAAIAGFIV